MARAKRHYIPGYIWHITHRCHKRQGSKGSDVIEGGAGYNLREEAADYKALFEAENEDIGLENAYLWDLNAE